MNANKVFVLSLLAFVAGCSSDDNNAASDAGNDVTTSPDARDDSAAGDDSAPGEDTGAPTDGAAGDASHADASADAGGGGDASADAGSDAGNPSDAGVDASDDGACPSAWLVVPPVPDGLAIPDGGGAVVLHAVGTGTQNYACTAATSDAGVTSYTWTLTGPTADLHDCHEAVIGHHFASDSGAAFPEWQTTDGTYVIGNRSAAYTPDGGASSVAWLLLHATGHGGSGTLSTVQYVQRLDTDGGVADVSTCGDASVGATTQVPYSAEYFFYAP
jgi:hypothetical protein